MKNKYLAANENLRDLKLLNNDYWKLSELQITNQ